jgi:hypothetical protein
MTESTTSEVTTLIQEGTAALQAGNAIDARKYFRRATDIDAENVDAWIGLAQSVRSYKEKHQLWQHVLEIDPTNSEARDSLTDVEAKLAAGEVLAPPITSKVAPAAEPEADSTAAENTGTVTEVDYCYRHPDRETGLYCVQCGRPICTECVRPAFVGQLCPECARERRPRNYQVSTSTLLLTGSVTFMLSLVMSLLINLFLGGWFIILSFFIAPAAAEMVVRLLDKVTHAKRGREMQLAVGIAYTLGAAPWVLLPLLAFGFVPGLLPLGLIVFTVIAVVTLVARLR